jgi:hypothetical protein
MRRGRLGWRRQEWLGWAGTGTGTGLGGRGQVGEMGLGTFMQIVRRVWLKGWTRRTRGTRVV